MSDAQTGGRDEAGEEDYEQKPSAGEDAFVRSEQIAFLGTGGIVNPATDPDQADPEASEAGGETELGASAAAVEGEAPGDTLRVTKADSGDD